MATKQQADQELDPKYEWQENAANFLLRVHLSGFRKEDFRVQVDGAGRLTIRGQRADGGKHIRFHKVFQLPPTSNLDDISGRFDAGVLILTVPKRPAPPPATIDDIRKPAKEEKTPPPQVQGKDVINKKPEEKKAEHHKEETNKKPEEKKAEHHKQETNKKPEEKKAADDKIKQEVEAKMKAAYDKIKQEVEAKMKAADERMEEEAEAKRSKPDQAQKKTAPPAVRKEEGKPKVERPTETKPPQQAADKVVDRESLLERVRRRAEEEGAKAAAAEEAERQKKQSACGGWKERVAEELHGLKASEWAEGAVETMKKNREVIAAAVAAFSLGLFVSRRLFSRN